MNPQTEIRHKQAREIIRYHGNVNKTAMARLLVEADPITWDNVEQARRVIKYITGCNGDEQRRKNTDKSLHENKEDMKKNIYGLQPELHNDFTPYIIPKSQKKVGVLSDIHLPYQDNEAVTLALDYIKDKECDTIVINGDLIDFYMASRFQRDPGQRDLKYELDCARSFFEMLRTEFQDALIIFKTGNHEDRWRNFLLLKAPEVFNMSEFKLDIILRLSELGVIFVDNKKIIKAGKLNIIHGHEYYGAYSPVNPAKAYHTKGMANVMAGHNHQSSEHISKDMNDEITGAWSLGCLCELHPLYMPLNKWVHGFATVDITDDKGNFRVINKMIINGEVL